MTGNILIIKKAIYLLQIWSHGSYLHSMIPCDEHYRGIVGELTGSESDAGTVLPVFHCLENDPPLPLCRIVIEKKIL